MTTSVVGPTPETQIVLLKAKIAEQEDTIDMLRGQLAKAKSVLRDAAAIPGVPIAIQTAARHLGKP